MGRREGIGVRKGKEGEQREEGERTPGVRKGEKGNQVSEDRGHRCEEEQMAQDVSREGAWCEEEERQGLIR